MKISNSKYRKSARQIGRWSYKDPFGTNLSSDNLKRRGIRFLYIFHRFVPLCVALGARALAAAAEPYAYTHYSRLVLPCAAPSPHLSCEPCRRRRSRSPPRLCGNCLSPYAAPTLLESVAAICLPMYTYGSLSRRSRQHPSRNDFKVKVRAGTGAWSSTSGPGGLIHYNFQVRAIFRQVTWF